MANDLSTFISPNYIVDQFDELQDMTYDDSVLLQSYIDLKLNKQQGLPVDETLLATLEIRFQNKIVTSSRWNKFQTCLLNMENFIKNEVQDFVIDKQVEINTYSDARKVEVETYTDTKTTELNNSLAQFNHKLEYSPSKQYFTHNTISLEGESFIALIDSLGQSPNHNVDTIYWAKIAKQGATGINGVKGDDGVGLIFKKDGFNLVDTFIVNDCLQYDGSLWACIQDCIGQTPSISSIYWKLAVAKGSSTVTKILSNYVKLTVASVNIPIGISGYNSTSDTLIVYKDGILQNKVVNYKLNANGTSVDSFDGTVYPIDSEFDFQVQKNINQNIDFADASLLQDLGVTKNKLSQDVQDGIDKIGSDTLTTTAQDLSGAANENSNKIAILNGVGGNVEKANKTALDTTNTNVTANTTNISDNVKHPTYAVTTGSANTYLVAALTVYNDGTGITVKINADSTGISTLNGKGLKNSLGNDITNLKNGGIYSFRYNATTSNFIIQSEGVDASSLITATNLILNM